MSIKKITVLLGFLTGLLTGVAQASLVIPMQWVAGANSGKSAGYIRADDTPYGLMLTPHLQGFSQGMHGFHVHAIPLCDDGGRSAGGHFDPVRTNVHLGPYHGSGHLGDLPVLMVGADGKATLPVLAPRLTLSELKGHSLMIHAGGDDYSKNVQKLPGSMIRIACGVVPWH